MHSDTCIPWDAVLSAVPDAGGSQRVCSESGFLWGYEPDVTDPREGVTSRNAYVSEGMYWHIYTDVRKRGEKAVRDLQDELMSKSIIKPEDNFEIEVNYRNLLLSKKSASGRKLHILCPSKDSSIVLICRVIA